MKQHEADVDVLEASIAKSPSNSDAKEAITQLKQKLLDLISRSENGITLITVRFNKRYKNSFQYCIYNFYTKYLGYNPTADST